MTQRTRERLASGVADIASDDTDDDDDDEPFVPEIIPIGEGDITKGLSGEDRHWDRDLLARGVENGAFDNAKLLKGRPGSGHKPHDEQADPDEIVGDAGSFSYIDGEGPKSNGDGALFDEHLATLIENDLVEISPDIDLIKGEYNEEKGAREPAEIVDVPYMTILDRGAGTSASIDAAEQEALADLSRFENLSDPAAETEQLAEEVDLTQLEYDGTTDGELNESDISNDAYRSHYLLVGDTKSESAYPVVDAEGNLARANVRSAWNLRGHIPDSISMDAFEQRLQYLAGQFSDPELDLGDDGTEQNADGAIGAEQLASLDLLRFYAMPGPAEVESAEAYEGAASAVDAINGVTSVLDIDTGDSGEIHDAELFAILDPETVDLGSLNDDIQSAIGGTPFEVADEYNWVEDLEHEYLSRGTQAQPGNERPDSRADSDTTSDSIMPEDNDVADLTIEQLAARNEAVADLQDTKETLQSEKEDLESTTEDLESEVEEKEDTIDSLEEDTEHIRRRYATEAVGGNEDAAEALVESDNSVEDLAEMALDDETEPDEDEQLSAVERVEEQLAASPNTRGNTDEDEVGNGSGDYSEEQLAEADDLAKATMSGTEIMEASNEQLSGRQYVKQHKGVDPAEYDSENALRSAIDRENGGDN